MDNGLHSALRLGESLMLILPYGTLDVGPERAMMGTGMSSGYQWLRLALQLSQERQTRTGKLIVKFRCKACGKKFDEALDFDSKFDVTKISIPCPKCKSLDVEVLSQHELSG